jgi:hypothetical protein
VRGLDRIKPQKRAAHRALIAPQDPELAEDVPKWRNRSNELCTSRQAVSRLGAGEIDGIVVAFIMALLSFAESAPRA